jgi:anti-sigma-K factor RskA
VSGGTGVTHLTDNDIAFAGEYVLGLLAPADHAVAASRAATDAEFAREIEAWNERLQHLLGSAAETPNAQIWQNIMAALPARAVLPANTGQDNGKRTMHPVRIWQGLTAVSSIAAAVLALIAFQPRADQPAQQQPQSVPAVYPQMVAALGSTSGPSAITIQYDTQNGQMLMTPVSLKTGKLYPELWIIPEDGKARSLGMLRGDAPSLVRVTPEMRQYMHAGATLAITPEPIHGGPGGKATGPIIASGKIISI